MPDEASAFASVIAGAQAAPRARSEVLAVLAWIAVGAPLA